MKTMPFILGLTGPTGAGKSMLCAYFLEKDGAAVIDADRVAREVVCPGPVLQKLTELFGREILRADGSLDRVALAQKAFSSPEATAGLNAVTHPAICEKMRVQLDEYAKDGKTFIILDAPLLFEAGADRLCTKTLAVLAGEELRAGRIRARDALSPQSALLRIRAGQPDSFYRSRADGVLWNRGNAAALFEAAEEWLRSEGRSAP